MIRAEIDGNHVTISAGGTLPELTINLVVLVQKMMESMDEEVRELFEFFLRDAFVDFVLAKDEESLQTVLLKKMLSNCGIVEDNE